MTRKTISLVWLRTRANAYLRSEGSTPHGRRAVFALAEALMQDARAYQGFTKQTSGPYQRSADDTRREIL